MLSIAIQNGEGVPEGGLLRGCKVEHLELISAHGIFDMSLSRPPRLYKNSPSMIILCLTG